MNLLTPNKSDIKLSKKDIWTPTLLAIAIVIGMLAGLRLKNEPLVDVAQKKTDLKTEPSDVIGQGRMEEILRYVEATLSIIYSMNSTRTQFLFRQLI
jgi:hypothetical protein